MTGAQKELSPSKCRNDYLVRVESYICTPRRFATLRHCQRDSTANECQDVACIYVDAGLLAFHSETVRHYLEEVELGKEL